MYFNHISIYSSTYKVTLDYLNHDLYVCTIALTFFLLCFVFYCCGLSAVFNELMMMMMMMTWEDYSIVSSSVSNKSTDVLVPIITIIIHSARKKQMQPSTTKQRTRSQRNVV